MKKLSNLPLWGSFLLISAIFAYFSFLTPYMTDNYIFSLDISPGYAHFYTGSPVIASPMTLKGAFRQACEMYGSWCGRFMGNLSVYLLFMLPSALWHTISAIAFGAYVLVMQVCIFGHKWRENLSPGWILALAGLLWLSIPSFGEAFFWLSVGGQLALLFQLIILLPYRLALDVTHESGSKIEKKRHVHIWILSILFFLTGVVACSLDYPSSAALPPTAVCALIYLHFFNKKKPGNRILIWGAIGLCVGAAFTLLAPGNAARLQLTSDQQIINWLAFTWPDRILHWLAKLPSLIPMLAIPLFLLLWALYSLKRESAGKLFKNIPVAALFFLLPFAFTIGAYLFTAWPPKRAFATCSVQLLLAALIILGKVRERAPHAILRQIHYLRLLLALCCILSISKEGFDFYELHQLVETRESLILSAADSEVELPPIHVPANKYQVLGGELADLKADPEYWVNRAMSIHYGLKNPAVEKPLKIYVSAPGLVYHSAAGSGDETIKISLKRQRLTLKADREMAPLLENGVHIYYYGRPAILSSLWRPFARLVYEWLSKAQKGDLRLYLVPLLMARTDLKTTDSRDGGYAAASPLLQMDNPETIWLVEPGADMHSFRLIPFKGADARAKTQ